MKDTNENRPVILIADDSEMNRSFLKDMLEDEYEIWEAEDGKQAVAIIRQHISEISLLLLDVVMPEMDGLEVLAMMNKYHWIEDIPVVMISAENATATVRRCYDLGITDYVSRPFNENIVKHRVNNTIMLYEKQKRLVGLVTDQIFERQKDNNMMINILSHIVEFRNGESGLHVLHINTITELLLNKLVQMTDKYQLSRQDISLISTASALHDIGKIAIPEEILNKPGRFVKEEFEIMKKHSVLGAAMLEDLPLYKNEPLVKVAYEICRWHHERYDGKGYPDGLRGEEIPISAQVVSIADVYDALTSERVYKKAYSHDVAMEMILNGECGSFNPILLECLCEQEMREQLKQALKVNSLSHKSKKQIEDITTEIITCKELGASERTLRLLEHEREKYRFFASMSKEVQFEYTNEPPMALVSDWGVHSLGVEEVIMDPYHNEQVLSMIGKDYMKSIGAILRNTTLEHPIVEFHCTLQMNGEEYPYHFICRAIWTKDEKHRYIGCIGKAVDIQAENKIVEDIKDISCKINLDENERKEKKEG